MHCSGQYTGESEHVCGDQGLIAALCFECVASHGSVIVIVHDFSLPPWVLPPNRTSAFERFVKQTMLVVGGPLAARSGSRSGSPWCGWSAGRGPDELRCGRVASPDREHGAKAIGLQLTCRRVSLLFDLWSCSASARLCHSTTRLGACWACGSRVAVRPRFFFGLPTGVATGRVSKWMLVWTP